MELLVLRDIWYTFNYETWKCRKGWAVNGEMKETFVGRILYGEEQSSLSYRETVSARNVTLNENDPFVNILQSNKSSSLTRMC